MIITQSTGERVMIGFNLSDIFVPRAACASAAAAAVRQASVLDPTWLLLISDQYRGHGRSPWPFL